LTKNIGPISLISPEDSNASKSKIQHITCHSEISGEVYLAEWVQKVKSARSIKAGHSYIGITKYRT